MDGWRRAALDDGCSPPSFLGTITKIDDGLASSLLGAFGGCFGRGKDVIGV